MSRQLLTLVLTGVLCVDASAETLSTPVVPATNEYHGVAVSDPYQWLEDADNKEVREWADAQNTEARRILDASPVTGRLRQRITEIEQATSVSYFALAACPQGLLALKRQPPLQQALLVVMPSPHDPSSERVLLDPNALDPTGSTTIDWFKPSADGRMVAVSMSVGGSESGDVHTFDTSTAEKLGDQIPRVNGGTAGGDVAWHPDGSGFYYTRYPRPGDRPESDLDFYQQVWFHDFDQGIENDHYEIGREFPRIAEIGLELDNASGRLLATVQYGDSGRFAFYLRETDGRWNQIIDYDDEIVQATFGTGGNLYVISIHGAPKGEVLKLSLSDPQLEEATHVILESEDTIVSNFYAPPTLVATRSKLYVTYQLGGPSEIRVFDLAGQRKPGPDVLPISNVSSITPMTGDEILYENRSYTRPPAWFSFDAAQNTTKPTALRTVSPVDFSDTEVVQEWTRSKDGTRIPINIIRKVGTKLDGTNPVLLTGYGGYGLSVTPRFLSSNRVWLEQGGIYAVATIRGGGEFGETWHKEGMLTKKQNVFDDFAAAMQHMIEARYTSSDKLAIVGGSNGGLLMGAMLTQHPKMFAATVSHVGIYDMMRVELSPNGAFNIPEFGSVQDPYQAQALLAYSPYHNVAENTPYPSVLFMTGANDARVDPMHSRKMAARLQAATSSRRPILLRLSSNTGHGGGTPLDERINQLVDEFAFLMDNLKMEYR